MKRPADRPLVIGLLGGIASGKSFVARTLAEWGASVFDADIAGHEALTVDSVKQAVRERWGEAVFDKDNNINRKAVAQIVFAPGAEAEQELKYLEQLTHPVIRERMQAALVNARTDGVLAFVLDAAVLQKAGWNKLCHDILFVDAPTEVRMARAAERGWSKEEFKAREAAQELLDDKRRLATVFIENSGNKEQTRSQLAEYWLERFGAKPF